MVRRKSKSIFWLIFFAIVVIVCVKVFSQDSAVEIFQRAQRDEHFNTKDGQQDWTVFWLCREIDSLRDLIAANEVARREDDKEVRAQLWQVALIVGGGGAVGGAGTAAVVKRRRKRL